MSADDQCLKFWPPRVNSGLLNGNQLMAVMDPEFFFSIYKLYYIISSVMHAFWLVLTYDLLEDRCIVDIIIKTFISVYLILYYIKQIDSKLLCVCSVIDHRGCQNVVRTSVTHSAAPCVPLFCSYHILMSSVIYYWTDAQQLGIYLLNIYIYQLHWVSLSIKDVVEYFIVLELWSWIANLYFEICFRDVQICGNVFLSSEIWPSTCGESFLILVSL